MELVREMKSMGLSMDDVLYGTLISVCASNNQCDEAEKYFDEMKSEGHSPNVFHYSSLLNAYAIDGNYSKADNVIQEMRSAGLTLNKVYFRAFLVQKQPCLFICTGNIIYCEASCLFKVTDVEIFCRIFSRNILALGLERWGEMEKNWYQQQARQKALASEARKIFSRSFPC